MTEFIGDDGNIESEFLSISVDEYNEENFPDEFEAQVLDDHILENFGTLHSSKEFDKIHLMN